LSHALSAYDASCLSFPQALRAQRDHRMVDRRWFLHALGTAVLGWPCVVDAQAGSKIYTVGYLGPGKAANARDPDSPLAILMRGVPFDGPGFAHCRDANEAVAAKLGIRARIYRERPFKSTRS